MTNEVFWAIARSTGVMSLLLLTASVALGVVTRSARPLPFIPRFAVMQIHRSVSLLSLVFVLVHVGSLLFDRYSGLNLLDFFVPFISSSDALTNGLGTLALDLLLALAITGILRARISEKLFHLVHWGAYACWPLTLAHGLGSGSDSGESWFLALCIGCIGVVALALVARLRSRFMDYSHKRTREVRS